MANASIKVTAHQGIPEIVIFGAIGEGDINIKSFQAAWKSLGKPPVVHVRISSPGGDCFLGAAIHDIIVNSGLNAIVYIDGLAASMASFIAMAGSKVIMGANAQFMIHNPVVGMSGSADDLARARALLDSIRNNMIRVYSKRSRQPEATIAKWMDEETWFDAAAAVKAGFADEIAGELKMAATSFDLTTFKHAPKPTSIGEYAESYWAKRRQNGTTSEEDISDLVPTPTSAEDKWRRFHGKHYGRAK